MANRFWVGGSGNWSDDTNHWATASGGAPGAGNLPTASDNAIFDAASNATAYTVTIDAVTKVCNDLNFSAAPSGSGTITWAGSVAMNISGSLTCLSGMTRTYTGTLTFNSTATGKTITLNAVALNGPVTFDGSGGGWQLQDAFNIGNTRTLTLVNGTLDTNGVAVNCNNFSSTGAGTRTLTLGASTVTVRENSSSAWDVAASLTLNANTSTISVIGASVDTIPEFNGAGLTYNNVTTGNGFNITGANVFNDFTMTTVGESLTVAANQTVGGTLALSGVSGVNRLRLNSSVLGTARTITAAAVSLTDVEFQDITGAGAAAPFTGTRLSDCEGNSGITFTTASNKYWVGGTASWGTASWATSSGGAGATANGPLIQDTAIFDANSFTANNQICTLTDGRRLPHISVASGITFTGCKVNVEIFGTVYAFGDITQNTNVQFTGDGTSLFLFSSRGTRTLTSNGITNFGGSFLPVSIDSPLGGTLALGDDFETATDPTLVSGTLDLNDKNITTSGFNGSNTNTRAILMGSGTWTLTGGGTVWSCATSTGLTVTPGTSTIKLTSASVNTKTFSGGGKAYNNIWLTAAGTGTFDFTGSNTFNDFKCDTPPHSIRFTAGTTTTVTTFDVSGTAGNLMTIGSITAAGHTLTKAGGGTIVCDYLSVSRSTATPAATWYAGANSTDGGNNSGWFFGTVPAAGLPWIPAVVTNAIVGGAGALS